MKYLKDKQYYINLYDLFTIKECLEQIEDSTNAYRKFLQENNQSHSKAEIAKAYNWSTNQMLYLIKAKRYQHKEETIQQWMDKDQIEQEKYDTTPEPRNIRCPDCKKIMQCTIKHLETLDNPLRMMFLFNCSSCKKKRWIYEDGTERKSTPSLCPKCKAELKITVVKESKEQVVWKTTCTKCEYTETTIDDFIKSRAEQKQREEKEKKLLERYRNSFCSEKEGKEAFEYIEALNVAHVVFDEELKKFDSPVYQKVARIKKLSIIDLEKLLQQAVEGENYRRLTFDNPQIGQHIIVQFTTQDSDSSRNEDKSTMHLKKLITETLEDTNWRLMSDGISYRLGLLTGRLKGYEKEENFFEISGQTKEEDIPKLDYETRMEYEGHNVVQLAKLMGQYRGIENVRKRRLKKEPEGFFLEANDDYYQCGICGSSMPSAKTWWNLDGVRCTDCQRNIKEGIISSEVHKNRDSWVANWQLSSEHDFNIHPSKVKRLRREGLLIGRDLTREDGSVYYTVYLLNENKDFLKEYPRKPRKKMVITDLLGNKIEY